MSKSSELDRTVKTYLLTAMSEDSDGIQYNIVDSIGMVECRFYAEYGHEISRQGLHGAIREWLMGLALPIDYNNYDILNLAVLWQSIPADYSEKQVDKILENYWSFMAHKLLQLFNGRAVPKSIEAI